MRATKSLVEHYFSSLNPPADPLIEKSRQAALGLGLQQISLGDLELQILKSVIALHQSQNFIEIGTLTGTSGLAILEALPEAATFWTFEKEPRHAELAKAFLNEAALKKNQKVVMVLGDARLRLADIEASGPFDGIFIDGNKAAYGDYLAWAEKNIKKGGLIIADNVFLSGAIFESNEDSFEKNQRSRFSPKQIQVMRDFNKRLMDASAFQSCLLPTEEGLFIAIKI